MMDKLPGLSAASEAELLRKCWYSHDARWFMCVAQEFGMEAANRLNRRAVRELGRVEAPRLARALGMDGIDSLEGLARLMDAASHILFPQPGMEFEVKVIDSRSYEASFQRCFVHENIVRVGIGASYRCAVFDRLQGWHDGLGLPLAEDMPAAPCAKYEGLDCRRIMRIQPASQRTAARSRSPAARPSCST